MFFGVLQYRIGGVNFVNNRMRMRMEEIIMVHHIEEERVLSEVINNSKVTVIDFFATWCGPCQMLAPVIKELDQEYEGRVEFYKVDVDESQECAVRYGITAMPTLVFFKDGQEVERQVGFLNKEEIKRILDDILQ